jgi:hypothetical protein
VFTNDKNDLTRTLGEMEYLARQKTNFNQVEAKEKMREWLAQDRRFDGYDPNRLIERVHEAKFSGAQLDLDDPQLRKGGQPRPLDRWR